MTKPSTLVTLIEAGVGYRTDGELWGGIVVKTPDGQTRMYAQFLPQAENLDPPGWSAIAELTGVQAEDVVHGWDDKGLTNPVAEYAFQLLRNEIGREFAVRERAGVQNEKAVELIPIKIVAIAELDLDTGHVLDSSSGLTLARVSSITHPQATISDTTSPIIRIEVDGIEPLDIRIPDEAYVEDPHEWFIIESILSAPAIKVSRDWHALGSVRTNKHVPRILKDLTLLLMGTADAPRFVPVRDGHIDLNALRTALVRERIRQKQKQKPLLYTGRPPEMICDRAWLLMKDAIGEHLFRYNVERGVNSGVPAVVRSVEGQTKLEVLDTKEKMRGALFAHVDFCTVPAKGPIKYEFPQDAIAQHMILFADQSVPAINALVRIPTMRRDGTIHDAEGYDHRSRIWYAPEFKLEPIPDRPTESDIRKAYGDILVPFSDFPFVNESARAAAVACLLEQIVRPMIDGPRPLYAFDAPAFRGQGTGKGLLASTIGAIITGQRVAITPWPEDPRELAKTITTLLLKSSPYIFFDNLEGQVKHKDLAALATTEYWCARLLHTNDSPNLLQVATIVLTLNGARFNNDIARRTATIKLNAEMARPYQRANFRIANLVPWALQNRANIIRACLILARAWVVAGRPHDPKLRIGSFEGWAHVVGGIVRFSGFESVSGAFEESRARDTDSHEHDEFIRAWADIAGGSPVTALQLAAIAESHSLYASVLEPVKSPIWKGRHMAEVLRKLEGHSFAGWVVQKSATRTNGVFIYSLQHEGMPNALSSLPAS